MQGMAAKGRAHVDHGEEMAGNMLERMATCEVERTRVSLSEEGVDVEFHSCTRDGKWEVGVVEPWGSDPTTSQSW